MKSGYEAAKLDQMRSRLRGELSSSWWVVGALQDERCCLLLENGEWVAGFYERGTLSVWFRTVDAAEAESQFVKWVRAGEESMRRR